MSDVLPGDLAAALPRDNGELVFQAPWQGRVVAMAVGVVDRLGLEWDDFRHRLIAAISDDPDRPYYESWLAALEELVAAATARSPDRQRLRRRPPARRGRASRSGDARPPPARSL